MSKTTLSSRPTNQSLSKAQIAEGWIAKGLEAKGWKILKRNFRAIGSELDIVALKGETLAVVEVKARHRLPLLAQDMVELVPFKKRAALKRGIIAFLQRYPVPYQTIRFDLALVEIKNPAEQPGLKYFLNAFEV